MQLPPPNTVIWVGGCVAARTSLNVLKKGKVFFTSYSTLPVYGPGFCLNSEEKLPLQHNTSITDLVSHVHYGPSEDGNQGAEEVGKVS